MAKADISMVIAIIVLAFSVSAIIYFFVWPKANTSPQTQKGCNPIYISGAFRCNGNTLQQLYQQKDCSEIWVDKQDCANGCQNGSCSVQTIISTSSAITSTTTQTTTTTSSVSPTTTTIPTTSTTTISTTTTTVAPPDFQSFTKDTQYNPLLLGHTEPAILNVGNTIYLYYRTDHSIGVATSSDGINWNDIRTILTYSPGQWDSDYVISPSVIFSNNKYYLFYEGNNGQESAIGVAISDSPTSGFTKYSGNPILTKGSGFENVLVGTPAVVSYNNSFYLFYHGYDGTSDRGAVAVSSDLVHWTKSPNNPTLDLGPQNSWDNLKTAPSSALVFNNKFYIFYEGFDGTHWRIGLATQNDPMQKLKKSSSNPILDLGSPGSWDDFYAQLPEIANISGTWWLYYSGNDGSAFHLGRALAVSSGQSV